MTIFQAIILGIIQGLTEFFPVSSSGHLTLAQHFLGLTHLENYVLFDLVCHLGTLCAILILFASKIIRLFRCEHTKLMQLIIATLPLFPLVFFLKPLEHMFGQPQYLGFFFLVTALLLFVGIKWGREASPETIAKNRWRDSFTIGVFQAMAILPGISRSGSTLTGASLLGWNKEEAITFSFLLAIPAILGGTTLQILKLYLHPTLLSEGLDPISYAAAFFASFIVGYFTLLAIIKLAMKGKLMYFVLYCVILSIGTTFYFL